MPWTYDNPPAVAQNWSQDEIRDCVDAANAVLDEGGTDEEAIYACINAAGKGRGTMQTKTFQAPIEFKSEETGEFSAIFSTFDVVDKEGDVVVPGAIKDGEPVRISYWGHRWQDLPVGRGVVRTDEEKAWVDGKFFLDTQIGKETYRTVRNLGDLQRWSYGFDIKDAEQGQMDGEDVRYLKDLEVFEVSPVLLAASMGTATTSMKNAANLTDDEVERLKTLLKEQQGAKDGASVEEGDEGEVDAGEAGDGKPGDKPSGTPPSLMQVAIDIAETELDLEG